MQYPPNVQLQRAKYINYQAAGIIICAVPTEFATTKRAALALCICCFCGASACGWSGGWSSRQTQFICRHTRFTSINRRIMLRIRLRWAKAVCGFCDCVVTTLLVCWCDGRQLFDYYFFYGRWRRRFIWGERRKVRRALFVVDCVCYT